MMISTHFIEVHMNLEKLKEKLIPILAKKDLTIYSIRTKREFGEKIVEILIDTELMDIDELEKIHLEYQETLTDEDLDPDYKNIYAEKDGDVYILKGSQLKKIFDSTNFSDIGSLRYLYQYIAKRGGIDDLKDLGLEEGDTIRIEDFEFEYIDEE